MCGAASRSPANAAQEPDQHEYQRLVQTGELARHLVDAPSRPMTLGSRVLGITLIAFGLILLILVLVGFVGSAG